MGRCGLVLIGLLAAVESRAQFPNPTPYPGGGPYPQQTPYPGQYPPGQYPPGQYPGTIGGPGIELPVPRLPGRKDKDKDSGKSGNTVRVALRAADGTLRELNAKELYLETARHTILKFRLLAKTQFQNKKGDQVRDSLLARGDQLSVEVRDDDPETAVRVILMRAGTEAERTAAGRPFDHESAKAPEEADTHSSGSTEVTEEKPAVDLPPASSTSAGSDDGSRPTLKHTTASEEPEQAQPADRPPTPPRTLSPDDEIIDATRDAADHLNEGLPDFIVQQNTTRYLSTTIPSRWRALDVVTAEVVSVGGKEEYRNIQVNGKPSNRPPEKSGAWSTGEFQTTLESLLSPYSSATFKRAEDDTLGGRAAYRYHFSVKQENSNWDIWAPDGSKATPSYTGTLWIDKTTHNALRIEEQTGPMPASFAFDKAESVIEYNFVRIESSTYPLPVYSEVLTCQRGSAACTKNEIRFQNYRKFGADSTVTFGK